MHYILEDNVRLGKWKGSPPCAVIGGKRERIFLSDEEYALLRSCDGKTALEPDDTLYRFELMRFIRRCAEGEAALKPGQMGEYPNYFFRNIDWTITERCNYNCLHCFHAADNDVHRAEFSEEEAMALIREAVACGISGFRLTGGEPTLYPYFQNVVEEIGRKGLALVNVVTNGSFLDEERVRLLKEVHPDVEILLSFDGIGTHDWLRQHAGSEEQVKKTIRRCKDAGLRVRINMNVNRRNLHVIPDSVRMLDAMGVDAIRLIKTTEAPRWQLNAAGDSLTIEEYYAFSAAFAAQYRESRLRLPVAIWQSLFLNGKNESFSILPVKSSECSYNGDAVICSGMINKISVQANGDVIPCAPLAGLFTQKAVRMGNVKREGLQKLLSEGPLVENVMKTAEEKRRFDPKCGSCRYFKCCRGGCPAISMLFGGSLLSADVFKCAFFECGWYERYCEVLDGWKNMNPM